MDLPPPVQDPERREDADDPGRRLAAVEAELIALGARMEQLEASLQQAVREETRRASNEIRHTVSELGRRLALDLPQFLDRHRQLIVGELRGVGAGSAGGAAAGAGAESAGDPAGSDPVTGTTGGSGGGGDDGKAGDTGAASITGAGDLDEEGGGPTDDSGGGRRKRRRRKDG
jgi:hypothetical protein